MKNDYFAIGLSYFGYLFFLINLTKHLDVCYDVTITMRGLPKGLVPRECLSFLFFL